MGSPARYQRYLRIAAVGTTVSNLLFAVATLELSWLPTPPLWASFYFIAGLACLYLVIRPDSTPIVAIAGGATITAHIMRGAVLIMGKTLDLAQVRTQPWGNIFFGVVAAWTLAYFAALLFLTRVAPLASADRHTKA